MNNERSARQKIIRKITFTAVFAALAVALKAFTNAVLNIPVFGIKIGFAGIFTFFPAVICGPVWGGVASALSDVLGYLIAPDGAYIPWLTVTAFCGGVIKGLLWMLLTKKAGKKLRIALLCAFIAVGAAGAAFHISLASDGLISGMTAKQSELPYKSALTSSVSEGKLSPLSVMAVNTAKYKNDTQTLKYAEGENSVLPSYVVCGSDKRKITKIGSKALEKLSGSVTIPDTYKTIPDDALGDNTNIECIYGKEGSKAEDFAKKANIRFESVDEIPVITSETEAFGVKSGDFTVTTSDNYRKNLANYINMLVLGLELAGLIGALFVIINMLITKLSKNSERTAEIMKIALAVTVAGLITTTVNTFILRELLDAWKGKEFLILYIPRLAEELIVCVFHTYIISVLYDSIMRGRLKREIDKFRLTEIKTEKNEESEQT